MFWNQRFVGIAAGSLLTVCGMVALLPKPAGFSSLDGMAASAQVNERWEVPAAPPKPSAPEVQTDLQSASDKPAPTAHTPKTTDSDSQTVGRSLSDGAAAQAAAEEGSKSAAEVRRVRAAVLRTLRRTQESFRTPSD